MKKPLLLVVVLIFISGLMWAGCAARTDAPLPTATPITDAAYLTGTRWDDGQAEVAFYRVERIPDRHRQDTTQTFLAGTYLVKHDFDRAAMSKATNEAADAVSAFKYAFFYEFESGSFQYKRSYVVNAVQADLSPLKASFTAFDWCSNLYRELAFRSDGSVAALMRSDDYGNADQVFDGKPNAYPVQELPLLIRSLDFSEGAEQTFSVVQGDGTYVPARARLEGTETIEGPDGAVAAERMVLTYEAPVHSLIGEESDTSETYWRGIDAARLLLRLESGTGRYAMNLVEHLRTAYWRENLWPRLTRVTERP